MEKNNEVEKKKGGKGETDKKGLSLSVCVCERVGWVQIGME